MSNRYVIVTVIALMFSGRPTAASPATVQEILRTHRERQAHLTFELHDGSTLHGVVSRVHKLTFELADPDRPAHSSFRTIAYADLRLVSDDATGERFVVQPSPTGQMPRHHVSLKALIWVGVIVAVTFLVVYLLVPYT